MSLVDLREKVRAAVLREISIDDFEDWLVSNSWNMHQWAPPEVQRLVSYLELRLAEWSSEHLSDEALLGEFAVRLARLDAPVRPLVVRASEGVVIVSESASGASDTAFQRFGFRIASQGDVISSDGESGEPSEDVTQIRRLATA